MHEPGRTLVNGPILAALRRAADDNTSEVTSARTKQGKKCRQKEAQRCSADASVCRAQVITLCGGDPECIALGSPCCDTCSADGVLTCLLAASTNSNSRNAVVRLGIPS